MLKKYIDGMEYNMEKFLLNFEHHSYAKLLLFTDATWSFDDTARGMGFVVIHNDDELSQTCMEAAAKAMELALQLVTNWGVKIGGVLTGCVEILSAIKDQMEQGNWRIQLL